MLGVFSLADYTGVNDMVKILRRDRAKMYMAYLRQMCLGIGR